MQNKIFKGTSMKFPKQKMTASQIKGSKLFKQIEEALNGIVIDDIENFSGRTYRHQHTGQKALIYELKLNTGMEIRMYVAEDGSVLRVELDNRILESVEKKGDAVKITPKELGKFVAREVVAERRSEFKVKIDKRKMAKLVEEVAGEHSEEEERLAGVLEAVKEGGKFIALNADDEIWGVDGWTERQSEMIPFDTADEAKAVEGTTKVVEL